MIIGKVVGSLFSTRKSEKLVGNNVNLQTQKDVKSYFYIELQSKIGNYKIDRSDIYKEKEAEIKKILAECPNAKEIKEMLSLVGLDIKEFYSLYSKEKLNDAILYAKDLKDRYTVLWINYDYFGDEENV